MVNNIWALPAMTSNIQLPRLPKNLPKQLPKLAAALPRLPTKIPTRIDFPKEGLLAILPLLVVHSQRQLRVLGRRALSNRHHVRVLLSLLESHIKNLSTKNAQELIKTILFFRPINTRTLKPGTPLWKMLVKAVWVAIIPSLRHGFGNKVVKESVTPGVEVKPLDDESADVGKRLQTVKLAKSNDAADEEESISVEDWGLVETSIERETKLVALEAATG
jgi:hypothetical protein